MAFDENGNVYEFDVQVWTLKYEDLHHEGDPRRYGAVYDGVTDCSDAINECIQNHDTVVFRGSGTALCYDSIIVRSNTHLKLDHNFRIKLADGVNKVLIKNQWAEQAYFMEKNLINGNLPSFMPDVYPDYGPTFPSPNYVLGDPDENIKITGGILDGNGNNQEKQQWRYGTIGYRGPLLILVNLDRFVMEDVFLYNPCLYFADFCMLSNFFMNRIQMDFEGTGLNIDGLHFEGECRDGVISNIWGRTNDDMIALNGGDSAFPKNSDGNTVTPEANRRWYPMRQGRIENISIENIFSENGYRAIRLLSNKKEPGISPASETEGMDGISINGIYGTYRLDIILVSSHLGPKKDYGTITIQNIKARTLGNRYIFLQSSNINSLTIKDCEFFPTNSSKELILNEASINSVKISDTTINTNGVNVSSNYLISNSGSIDDIKMLNVVRIGSAYADVINNETSVEIIMSDFDSAYENKQYQVLTDAPTIQWDARKGSIAKVLIEGDRTIQNPTWVTAGLYSLIVQQDATGSRSLTYGNSFVWPSNTPPTLTTTPDSIDVLHFVSDGNLLYGSSQLDYQAPSGVEYYLHFSGTNDFVRARNASVFDVTTGDLDMEITFRTSQTSGTIRFMDKRGTGAGKTSYMLSAIASATPSWRNTRIEAVGGGYAGGKTGNAIYYDPFPNDGNWHTIRMTWVNSTGTLTLYQDGVQTSQDVDPTMIGKSFTSSTLFSIGPSAGINNALAGDIKSFRVGTETFDMNEGTGTTITGSEGTVLDINGATWQPI